MVEMKLMGLILMIALTLAACAPAGDEPVKDQAPATTTPVALTSDSPAPDAPDEVLIVEEDPEEEAGRTDAPGEATRQGSAGAEEATEQDSSTTDTEVTETEIPTTLEHPKYPDPEPQIPPPRD